MGPKKQSVTSEPAKKGREKEGGKGKSTLDFLLEWSIEGRVGRECPAHCGMPLYGPSLPCQRGPLNAKREKGEKEKGRQEINSRCSDQGSP
jgi:hypothetical protein